VKGSTLLAKGEIALQNDSVYTITATFKKIFVILSELVAIENGLPLRKWGHYAEGHHN
jgi:hypothetical protein